MKKTVIIIIFISLIVSLSAQDTTGSKDTFRFSGQAIGWGIFNHNKDVKTGIGIQYFPQINYGIETKKKHLFDLEFSLNINSSGTFDSVDNNNFSIPVEGTIKPNRAWIRYSNKQLEIRVGLQKINFGSAQMLRPLMWFDAMDARDPLGLTDGVYATLLRYYFLNNTNIWLWGMYGNNETKGWEWANTTEKTPEFGGRIQFPFIKGEMAFSTHYRKTDLQLINNAYKKENEYRLGFDYRIDWFLGSWIEASWVNYAVDSLYIQTSINEKTHLKNQENITLGSDYTFNIGNGLYTIFEFMIIAQDDKAFSFEKISQLSALGFSYPIGMFDNLNAYFYYDWENQNLYNYINWQHDFQKFTFYAIAYWNPKNMQSSNLIGLNNNNNLYTGKGIQIMLVYKY